MLIFWDTPPRRLLVIYSLCNMHMSGVIAIVIVNCVKQFTITGHRVSFFLFFLPGFCFSAVFHCLLGFVSCRLSPSIISSYRLMFHAVFHFLLFSLRVLFSSVFHFQILYHTDFCLMLFFTCELLCNLHFISAFYQCILSVHFINAFYQCISLVHFMSTYYHCILSIHSISAF